MSNESGDSNPASVRIAREEAHRTLDAQLGTLDDLDRKAISVFRLDIAVIGVLLSALSLVATLEAATVQSFFTIWTGGGVGLYVLSAIAAGLTYIAGGHRVGASPAGLERAATLSEAAYREWVVSGYSDWIRANDRVNTRKALLVTVAVIGAVAGTVALGVGVSVAVTDRVVGPAVVGAGAVIGFSLLAGLPTQLRRRFGRSEPVEPVVGTQDLESGMDGYRMRRGRDNP